MTYLISKQTIFWKNHGAAETPAVKFTLVTSSQFWVYMASTCTKSGPFQNGRGFFRIPEVGMLSKSSTPVIPYRITAGIDEKVRNHTEEGKCLLVQRSS